MSSGGDISTELDPCSNNGSLHFNDSQALVRVLCHKKDTEASTFLKRKYNLPASSGNSLSIIDFIAFGTLFPPPQLLRKNER